MKKNLLTLLCIAFLAVCGNAGSTSPFDAEVQEINISANAAHFISLDLSSFADTLIIISGKQS